MSKVSNRLRQRLEDMHPIFKGIHRWQKYLRRCSCCTSEDGPGLTRDTGSSEWERLCHRLGVLVQVVQTVDVEGTYYTPRDAGFKLCCTAYLDIDESQGMNEQRTVVSLCIASLGAPCMTLYVVVHTCTYKRLALKERVVKGIICCWHGAD